MNKIYKSLVFGLVFGSGNHFQAVGGSAPIIGAAIRGLERCQGAEVLARSFVTDAAGHAQNAAGLAKSFAVGTGGAIVRNPDLAIKAAWLGLYAYELGLVGQAGRLAKSAVMLPVRGTKFFYKKVFRPTVRTLNKIPKEAITISLAMAFYAAYISGFVSIMAGRPVGLMRLV